MYGPRAVLLHATAALLFSPTFNVMLPCASGRTTKIGRSGARPLATTKRSSAKIGVGAVIFELPPRRHSSLPVRGSYPRMKFDALVTRIGPALVCATVGDPHDGNSSRSVFHTVSPVVALNAIRNESTCVSTCWITRSFQMI